MRYLLPQILCESQSRTLEINIINDYTVSHQVTSQIFYGRNKHRTFVAHAIPVRVQDPIRVA